MHFIFFYIFGPQQCSFLLSKVWQFSKKANTQHMKNFKMSKLCREEPHDIEHKKFVFKKIVLYLMKRFAIQSTCIYDCWSIYFLINFMKFCAHKSTATHFVGPRTRFNAVVFLWITLLQFLFCIYINIQWFFALIFI